jgi:hypothetical protein
VRAAAMQAMKTNFNPGQRAQAGQQRGNRNPGAGRRTGQ